MAVPRVQANPWAAPRARAQALRERHSFAAAPLTLYLALLDVWEQAEAEGEPPETLAAWAARRVFPAVVAATVAHGPEPLAASMPADGADGADGAERLLAAWLAGEELEPVERYLARSSLRGALGSVDAGAACAADPAPRGERRCPRCGGPPQLSFRADTGDQLASGARRLQCARCAESWSFSSSACAFCAEGTRTVYTERGDGPRVGRGGADGAMFPHLRVEACGTCARYLIDVDLGQDPRAVPEVDEIVALPLDLYAVEHGYTKVTPNLMGF